MTVNTAEWAYQPCNDSLSNVRLAPEPATGPICVPGDFSLVTKCRILQAHRDTSTVISCTFFNVYISFQNGFAS